MDYAYIKQRITDLRIDKGVSEYQIVWIWGTAEAICRTFHPVDQNRLSRNSCISVITWELLPVISSMKKIRNRFSFKKPYPVCVHYLKRSCFP